MVRVKTSQKVFTEEEVSSLTGICRDHLRSLARSKHLGTLARVAEAINPETWIFTHSDLLIVNRLQPRCNH